MLLLVGTVCERKGQHDLADALGILPDGAAGRVRAFFVGDRPSPYSTDLHERIATLPKDRRSRVTIVPETSEVGPYLAAADLFVCTSRIESYPRVILEAMACGLPIVTTPVFGIREQVREDVNGLFYEPGDAAGLSAAIARLVADAELRARLAANAVPALDSLTDFDTMVDAVRPHLRRSGSALVYMASPRGSRLRALRKAVARQWQRVRADPRLLPYFAGKAWRVVRGGRLDKVIERNRMRTDWFSDYAAWAAEHDTRSEIALALLRERVAALPRVPRFGIVVVEDASADAAARAATATALAAQVHEAAICERTPDDATGLAALALLAQRTDLDYLGIVRRRRCARAARAGGARARARSRSSHRHRVCR